VAFEDAKAAREESFGPPPSPAPVAPPTPRAGAPAARVGDMTAHGGVITVGCPSVLIGGMPAARVSDMHNCPMVTGIVPHVSGPVMKGSPSVPFEWLPAARVGDQATCVGPPDVIALGHFTTMIGE
jgi:uncharacterized Zn-binding protein involved in type VI secretion